MFCCSSKIKQSASILPNFLLEKKKKPYCGFPYVAYVVFLSCVYLALAGTKPCSVGMRKG